jgi:phage shock protein A
MALLERVGTLLRANVNDLISRAEDPEKLAKQLVLDMENQLLQVKTQVAIAIADQHLLEKKKREHENAVEEWHKKAELAVSRQQDDLARAALDRSLSHQNLTQSFAQQLDDQTAEAELLRGAFSKLQQKLEETQSACEMLVAQHRRARVAGKANSVRAVIGMQQKASTLKRLRSTILQQEASNVAAASLLADDSLEDKFAAMDREEKVERLLLELKNRQPRLA